MNVENRETPGNQGAFAPQGNPTASGTQSVQRSGVLPTSGSAPVRRPLSGQVPVSTGARTATGAEHSRPAQPGVVAAPTTGGAPTTGTGSGSAPAEESALAGGIGKLKELAVKAKDTLTEGDDVAAAKKKGGPRKARVLVSRIDPWSALKIGFLLSIALGIMLVVAVFVLWNVLNSMGIFTMTNEWVAKLFSPDEELNLLQFFDKNKWMSATMLIAVVNVVLLTALSTLGAFLYNTVSRVVGGIYVTLTDD